MRKARIPHNIRFFIIICILSENLTNGVNRVTIVTFFDEKNKRQTLEKTAKNRVKNKK